MRTATLGLAALVLVVPLAAANIANYHVEETRCRLIGLDTLLDICMAQHNGNYDLVCPGSECILNLEHHAFTRGPWPGGWFAFSWIELEIDDVEYSHLLCTMHRAPAQNSRCDVQYPPHVVTIPVQADSECDITLRVITELEDETHQFGTIAVHEDHGCRTGDGTVYWT